MTSIIAGRFDTFDRAEHAAYRMRARGFRDTDLNVFYVNPPGQHARFAIGGDHAVDAGARKAGVGAGRGVLVGAVIGALLASIGLAVLRHRMNVSFVGLPVIVLVLATGLGAYLGSLVGALSQTGGPQTEAGNPPVRNAGVVLAAHVTPETEDVACEVLRSEGAQEVEEADGYWRDGRWADFDAVKPPRPHA